jgi:putative heme transporter
MTAYSTDMEVAEEQNQSSPERNVVTAHVSLTAMSGVRIACGLFCAFFLFQLARNLPDTLTRVALGVMFAFALDPVVVRLQRRFHCTRGASVTIVGIAALALFALLIIIVGPSAVNQAETSSRELPTTVDKLSQLPVLGHVLDHFHASERIRDWAANLPKRINDQSISNLIQSLIGGALSGFTVLVVGVACLLDGDLLLRRLRDLVPVNHRPRAVMVGRIFHRTIGAYFAGSLLVAILAATYVLVVGLSLGVPLAPVAALWVLIVTFIPQIGGFLAAVVFTTLGFGKGPGTAVACLVLYWMYMTFENHVIQPAVVGNAVDLSAAATMLAALIGGAALGAPGAILATPLLGTTKAIYMEVRFPDAQRTHRRTLFERIRGRLKRRFTSNRS